MDEPLTTFDERHGQPARRRSAARRLARLAWRVLWLIVAGFFAVRALAALLQPQGLGDVFAAGVFFLAGVGAVLAAVLPRRARSGPAARSTDWDDEMRRLVEGGQGDR